MKKIRLLWSKYQFERNLKHRKNLYDYEDTAFGHIWWKNDYPKIRMEYDRIRAGIIPANTIVNKITRLWNDQKYGTKFTKGNYKFEPEEFSKYGDLVVKEGSIYFSKMHVGLLDGPPDYIALGTGISNPTLADYQLGTEVARNNILVDGGYRDLVGEDEYYGMLFLPSIATNSYGEASLFVGKDTASGDVMVTHNKFSPVLSHTINVNAPGVDIVIKYRSYSS